MTKASLDRLVVTTSRLAEFCSEKELINQTGHDSDDWPLVILKELGDNSLDACEEAEITPVISVTEDGITVTDNGPGIAPETVADILDYNTRISSREAYCSPTRGAQGNALKTVIAMGFAFDGECGETLVESCGIAHRITFSIDSIRQVPWSGTGTAAIRSIGPFQPRIRPGASGGRPTRLAHIGMMNAGSPGSSPIISPMPRITAYPAARWRISCASSGGLAGPPRRKLFARQ